MVTRYFYDDNVTVDTNAQCFAVKVSLFLERLPAVMLLFPILSYTGNILRGESSAFAMTAHVLLMLIQAHTFRPVAISICTSPSVMYTCYLQRGMKFPQSYETVLL